MKKIFYTFIFMLLCMTAVPSMALQKVDVTVSWEKVQAAEKYRVELKDSTGSFITAEDTDANTCSFSLAPGKYLVRITGINKFHKQEGVSVWKELEVRPKQGKKPVPKQKSHPLKYYPGKIYLGAGYSPEFITNSEWLEIMENSMTGGLVYAGFDFSLFRTLSRIPVLRNMGLEFTGQGAVFKGKPVQSMTSASLTQFSGTGGLYYRIRTPLYFQLILHGQAGACMSLLKTEYNIPVNNKNKKSLDYMYRAGLSIRIPAGIFFMDFGAFYRAVLTEPEPINTLEPFFTAGFNF